MKKVRHRSNSAVLRCLILVVGLHSLGCTRLLYRWESLRAELLARSGRPVEALQQWERISLKGYGRASSLEAARRALQIAQFDAKDFISSERILRWLILNTDVEEERVRSQEALIDIYMDQFQDFEKASLELERLIAVSGGRRKSQSQIRLARAYWGLNHSEQAQIELEDLLNRETRDKDLRFEALYLRALIFQGTKALERAVAVYQQVLREFPERAILESVPMSLAFCFEELGHYAKAIETLEAAKAGMASPQFVDVRISKLRQRMQNLPGAQGLRR